MQKRSLWAPLLALSFAFHASAQFNGSIEGTVTDASKAGVPEAQVTLVQASTQVTQRATTALLSCSLLIGLDPLALS